MSDYPIFVYRKAEKDREDGSAFDTKTIFNDYELAGAILMGWHYDVLSALSPEDKPSAGADNVVNPADDNLPPTRDELELKASELGLKFDGRTSDRKLSAMIDEALKG